MNFFEGAVDYSTTSFFVSRSRGTTTIGLTDGFR